jgi:hypothetical protein
MALIATFRWLTRSGAASAAPSAVQPRWPVWGDPAHRNRSERSLLGGGIARAVLSHPTFIS